jgi:exodeoxyribonuclease-5
MVGEFLAQDKVLVAIITGYAGTGKTTLIRELSEAYGEPQVLTPTGKAALRVSEATGIFASTIHRYIYEPSEDPKTGQPVFKLKSAYDETFSDMEGKLVLIDEASMVDQEVWNDLCTIAAATHFKILLMGDLFQLPPVLKDKTGKPFSTLHIDTPFKTNLTEVLRQAQESPIIRASMILRSNRPEYEALRLLRSVPAGNLIDTILETHAAHGAAICFTNARRHEINGKVRERLGYSVNTVHDGEPLLVTQNNYNLNCYNGEVVSFEGWTRAPEEPIPVTDRFSQSSVNMGFGVCRFADIEATASPEQIAGKSEDAKVGNWAVRRAGRFWYKNTFQAERAIPHLDANYGYMLTCHKSQGSEWPEVLIVIEPSLQRLPLIERKRWLYTAATRGKHTVKLLHYKEPS